MSNTGNATFVLVALIAILLISGKMDRADEQNDQSLYCEMVETFTSTGGQYGWPAYKEGVQCP